MIFDGLSDIAATEWILRERERVVAKTELNGKPRYWDSNASCSSHTLDDVTRRRPVARHAFNPPCRPPLPSTLTLLLHHACMPYPSLSVQVVDH
jgi:hypothetical protein